MELKKGYKQTEIGVIPNDWEVKSIVDVAYVDPDNLNSSTKPEYRFNYISLEDVDNGTLRSTTEHTFKDAPSRARRIVEKGDVLVSTVRPNLKSHLHIQEDVSDWICSTGFAVLRTKGAISNNGYIYNHFFASILNTQIENLISGSNYPSINSKEVKSLLIPVPPTKSEQTAIATALSDADALIISLEKLIAKKRNIKQGAMQQLLKPKKGWAVKRLGELGKTFGGLSGKAKIDFANGKYPYIPFMNIMSNPVIDVGYFDYVNVKQGEHQNKALKGDLFFNGSSETPEEVGMCSVLTNDIPNLYLNSFCFGFRLIPDYNTNGLFLSYFFRSPFGRSLFFSSAQGATRYNLSKSNFLKLEIQLPPAEEQTRIANILSDMDIEIDMLTSKMEKCKFIKQGMMQNLLTGNIRLQ